MDNAVLSQIDLFAEDIVANPHHAFSELREGSGVYYSSCHDVWLVAGYAACKDVLRAPAVFRNHNALSRFMRPEDAEVAELRNAGCPHLDVLPRADPPVHTRQRTLANRAMSAKHLTDDMRGRVVELVDGLIDGFVSRGRAEFVTQFAEPLPTMVVLEALGLSSDEWRQFKRWSEAYVAPLSGTMSHDELIRAGREVRDFRVRLLAEVTARREQPAPGILSRLITAHRDGEKPFDDAEVVNIALTLLHAGNNTTTHALANTVYVVLSRPELRTWLAANPDRSLDLVTEVLRWDGPTMHNTRIAVEDTEVNGVAIPQGSMILVMLTSGNRDDAQFDCPNDIWPDRPDLRKHLSFGWGIHRCIGEPLALMELQVTIERLFKRLPGLRLEPGFEPAYQQSMILRGITRLPLVFDVRQAAVADH